MITLAASGTLQGKAGTASAITYTVSGDSISSGTDAFQILGQGQLGTSVAAMVTGGGSAQTLISDIHLSNTTGSAVSGITLYINGSAASNQILNLTIPANGEAVYTNDGWKIFDGSGNVQTAQNLSFAAVGSSPNANAGTVSAGTITLQPSSSSYPGVMTAAQFNKLANLSSSGLSGWVDVTLQSANPVLTSNSAATNSTNIASIISASTSGSTIYFPPGTYQFSSAILVGSKQFIFQGAGLYDSVLQTTSATADLFTLSDGNWYTEWRDLGLSTTVTKTAGNMITTGTASSSGNVGTHVRRCNIAGSSGVNIYNGIVFAGTNSAAITFVEDCQFTNFANYGISLVDNTSTNSTNSSLVINNSVMNGTLSSGNAVAGLQITQAGAVQIDNSDIIGCVNNMLVNPATGSPVQGVFSLYASNTYFDNSVGSCIKLTSTGNIERCKFDTCSFTVATGSTGYNAVEISSTATLLPTAIDFLNCNVFNTFGNTGTSYGFNLTGFTDINIDGCNIGGWTYGISATPSTPNGGSKVFIHNNNIGAIGNLPTNTTGIILNAGSFTYGTIMIDDNTFLGNTANITDNSTVITTATKFIQNNTGTIVSAPVANFTATTIPLTTVTNVDSRGGILIPAGTGTRPCSLRITVYATNSATTQTLTATLRYGTNNSNADTAVLTQAFTAGTAVAGSGLFIFDVDIPTSTTLGATIKFFNGNNAATGIAANTSLFAGLSTLATITTTANNWLGVYFSSATASAITIRSVKYEVQSQ